MIAFIRLAFFGLTGLSAIYVLVRIYARSVHRERLENQWDDNPPAGGGETERERFIEQGMRKWERGTGRKLLWLVVILPLVVFGVIIYLVNYQ